MMDTVGNGSQSFRNSSYFTCDLCDSDAIQETREGYVCQDCGCVLEIQKLVYNRPYEVERHQYAVLNKTRIGTRNERLRSLHSRRLEKLNTYQSHNTNDENRTIEAKIEINRILAALHCSRSLGETIFQKYERIRSQISPRTKYRSPEKLVPIIIYYYHKLNNRPINQFKLLEVARISKKDFDTFKLQINEFLPHYQERNRQEYILQLISELAEHYRLGFEFYHHAKHILYKLWDTIKNTTDRVIAGLISSILILCHDDLDITVSQLCTRLGIRMSTIQSQVKRRIMDRFRVKGFKSLVSSSNLLREVMESLGLLSFGNASNSGEEVPEVEIVEIQLGTARSVFNGNNTNEYYLYAVRLGAGFLLITPPKPQDDKYLLENEGEGDLVGSYSGKRLELWNYHNKGPPTCF